MGLYYLDNPRILLRSLLMDLLANKSSSLLREGDTVVVSASFLALQILFFLFVSHPDTSASAFLTLHSLIIYRIFKSSRMGGSRASLWELAPVGLEWCLWPDGSERFLNPSPHFWHSLSFHFSCALANGAASLSFPTSIHLRRFRLTFISHYHFPFHTFASIFLIGLIPVFGSHFPQPC